MYYLPPLNIQDSFDMDLLVETLLKQGLRETSYPGIHKALEDRIRGDKSWTVGTSEERLKHLRKLVTLYHPDMYAQNPELSGMFGMMLKSINHERTQILQNIESDNFESSDSFVKPKSRFSRFQRKDVTARATIQPISLEVTIGQLYNQEAVSIQECNGVLKCNGDIFDGMHKIINGRQVIIRVKYEVGVKKQDLDYIVTVNTNPIQLLYYTHKVNLPNGVEVAVRPESNRVFTGLGFTGKEGVGNLIVNYKIAKMPKLSKEIQKKLHELNLAVFYT